MDKFTIKALIKFLSYFDMALFEIYNGFWQHTHRRTHNRMENETKIEADQRTNRRMVKFFDGKTMPFSVWCVACSERYHHLPLMIISATRLLLIILLSERSERRMGWNCAGGISVILIINVKLRIATVTHNNYSSEALSVY